MLKMICPSCGTLRRQRDTPARRSVRVRLDAAKVEAVRAADCDQIRIQLTGGNRVAKLVPPQGESFIFLLMPIQLRQ